VLLWLLKVVVALVFPDLTDQFELVTVVVGLPTVVFYLQKYFSDSSNLFLPVEYHKSIVYRWAWASLSN